MCLFRLWTLVFPLLLIQDFAEASRRIFGPTRKQPFHLRKGFIEHPRNGFCQLRVLSVPFSSSSEKTVSKAHFLQVLKLYRETALFCLTLFFFHPLELQALTELFRSLLTYIKFMRVLISFQSKRLAIDRRSLQRARSSCLKEVCLSDDGCARRVLP